MAIKMLNLSLPTDREKLEELLAEDLDLFCQTYYEQGHRNHLGASEMGEECWRKLWYGFRWTKLEWHSGRMMRLFNVGHSAEPRFVAYLRGIGFEVREHSQQLWYSSQLNEYKAIDWDADLSGGVGSFEPVDNPFHIKRAESYGIKVNQYRISGAKGHYGGSLDGLCKAPSRYQLSEDIIFLNEFKTNGTGKGFSDVQDKGVAKAKPKHYSQMSQYGYQMKIKYGLYMIENKNDSSIIFKVVELDWNLGAQLEKKANDIIFSKEPPSRISDNPAFFNCKFCHQAGVCHRNEPVDKNCRSCREAEPIENGKWKCHRFSDLIPDDFIKVGCEYHLPISG